MRKYNTRDLYVRALQNILRSSSEEAKETSKLIPGPWRLTHSSKLLDDDYIIFCIYLLMYLPTRLLIISSFDIIRNSNVKGQNVR